MRTVTGEAIMNMLYHQENQATSISLEEARLFGSLMLMDGYRMVAGIAVKPDNVRTIYELMGDLDGVSRVPKNTALEVANGQRVVGPHYSVVNNESFCPYGIGIWERPATEQ